jgi:ABC-type sugar transport system ATPase subunit
VQALRDINLSVPAGMMVAVMGPSGSGKSTLLTIAGTLEEPTSGAVMIDGHDAEAMSGGAKARLRRRTIGYVFQDFNLLPGLTAAENVSLPLELDGMSARRAHLAGLAALAPGAAPDQTVQFAVLGYAITSMETETYRPTRLILLGEDASPQLRRSTSLDALVTPGSPPFFVWHTAEDPYVPPEHTYRFASALAASQVPHAVHVFARGPHSLGLAQDAGEAAVWTTLASAWIHEQAAPPG